MENIGNFLSGCEAYGCPKTDIFQTVDLYEAQNIPQVSLPTKMLFANAYRPVARIRITPVTLYSGVRKSRAGGPPLWRIVLTCDIRHHLGHLPGRVSAIEGVCRSVFGTVQHTVRHKRTEPSFVKKLAINTASVHFAIDKIRVVLQAWALIIRILYVTLLMTSRAMGLYVRICPY